MTRCGGVLAPCPAFPGKRENLPSRMAAGRLSRCGRVLESEMEDFFRAAAGSKMKQDKGGMPEAPAYLRFTPSGNAVRGYSRCYLFAFVLRFVSP